MEENKFLKVGEVATRYRISQGSILNKIKDGRLKAVKIGGTWRLYADQFIKMENAA